MTIGIEPCGSAAVLWKVGETDQMQVPLAEQNFAACRDRRVHVVTVVSECNNSPYSVCDSCKSPRFRT